MKVRAKTMGIYNASRVREGVVFDVPDGTQLASWMEPLDAAPSPKPAEKTPQTFSEMNRIETIPFS